MKSLFRIVTIIMMSLMSMGNALAQSIDSHTIENVIAEITTMHPTCDVESLQRGVNQAASLWHSEDGTAQEFAEFVVNHYATTNQERQVLFDKLCKIYEVLLGTSNQVSVELNIPTMLVGDEPTAIEFSGV